MMHRTALADRITEVKASTLTFGGHSVNLWTWERPVTGFMVSLKASEQVVPLETFRRLGQSILTGYIHRYREVIDANVGTARELHLGTWVDGGNVYIDLSVNVHDRPSAEALARQEHQKAYYDLYIGKS